MADRAADGNRKWQLACGAFAALALVAGALAVAQYGAVSTLRTQLAAATDEAQEATEQETKLRAQLSSAQDRVNSQGEKLAAAEQRAGAVERLSATEQKLDAGQQPAQREMPIRLTFHDVFFGSGKVAVLQNLSDTDLEVVVDVQSPATGAHERRRLVINAHSLRRLGPAQGWPFVPGQIVTLNNARFRPIVQTVS